MGSFIFFGKWNKKNVRNKLLGHARPKDAFLKLKDDCLDSMKREGTVREQRMLDEILQYFDAILPKNMSKNSLITHANLLTQIINLWGFGKEGQRDEDINYYNKRLRDLGVKPELHNIIEKAKIIYDHHNKTVQGIQRWKRKIQAEYGPGAGQSEVLLYNPTKPKYIERVKIEDAKDISMREAFRRAGGNETDYGTYLRTNNRDKKRRQKLNLRK